MAHQEWMSEEAKEAHDIEVKKHPDFEDEMIEEIIWARYAPSEAVGINESEEQS